MVSFFFSFIPHQITTTIENITHRQSINSHLNVISLRHDAKRKAGEVLKPSPESCQVRLGVRWTHLFLAFTISFTLKAIRSAVLLNGQSTDVDNVHVRLGAPLHVVILTPWFSHPVSLWHWGHRRAAWLQWLSAWYGLSAWQTFPVLCGEGIRTSVAIPVMGRDTCITWAATFFTYFIIFHNSHLPE